MKISDILKAKKKMDEKKYNEYPEKYCPSDELSLAYIRKKKAEKEGKQ